MRPAAAVALAAAALALAGCGGGKTTGGGSVPDGAKLVSADAPAFVALNSEPTSWDKVLKLARRFPLFTHAIDEDQLRQLKSAVGPEVDLVWTDFENDGDDVVALTKPNQLAKLKLALSGDVVFTNLTDGWVALAADQARLDRFKQLGSGEKLDGDDNFRDAFAKLDEAASVRAWVRGGIVQAGLDRELESGGAAPRITHDLGTLRALAASANAEGGGAVVELDGLIDPTSHPATFSPSLPDATPAGAVLYASATKLEDSVRIILRMVGESNREFDTQLKQVEGVLGLTLEDDVYPLLEDESALAVYRGGGDVPPILFLQKVDDEQKADSLVRRITALMRLTGDIEAGTAEVAGKTVQKLTFSDGTTVYDGAARGKIFVTNASDLAEQAVAGPNKSLADDELFRTARDSAALPDRVAAFAYGDLVNGLPFVFRLAEQSGSAVSAEARANTKPLETSFLYLVPDRNALRLSGFTTIK